MPNCRCWFKNLLTRKFRNAKGALSTAIALPDEIPGPIGDTLIERGLGKHRFATVAILPQFRSYLTASVTA